MSQTEPLPGLAGPPMRTSVAPIGTFDYPSLAELEHGLRAAATDGKGVPAGQEISIVGRRANVYASSHPSEILECRYADGRSVEIICKYSTCINHHHLRHEHRGGIPYEAGVYGILQDLTNSVPTFFGVCENAVRDELWMFMEYLGDAQRITKVPKEFNIKSAAWIANLHTRAAKMVSELHTRGFNYYDVSYYRGWIHRTLEFSESFSEAYPWLRPLAEEASCALSQLADGPMTMIHGEYYPHNILVDSGNITPIDWESAALGPGEIDLAAMTDGAWGAELIASCEEAYAKTRWPGGAPEGFRRRLDLARLYLHFRWLGERPERTRKESGRFERLEAVGRELELI